MCVLWNFKFVKFNIDCFVFFLVQFDALLTMLEVNEDSDIQKNACYTLSSFCTSIYGFELCVKSSSVFRRILIAIEKILSSSEQETVWFALM